MISSEYLYGGLDRDTAILQKALFKRKLSKAQNLIIGLKPSFNLLAFTLQQKELEQRIDKVKKAMEFCNEQIEEAQEVLNEVP